MNITSDEDDDGNIIWLKSSKDQIKIFISFLIDLDLDFGCTKCITEEEYVNYRVCYPNCNSALRTDEGFVNKIYDDYHIKDTPLLALNIGLVSRDVSNAANAGCLKNNKEGQRLFFDYWEGCQMYNLHKNSQIQRKHFKLLETFGKNSEPDAHPSSKSCSLLSGQDFQPSLETFFARGKSYEAGGQRAASLEEALVYMVCVDNMPLSTPDKKGFQNFCKKAVPLWKPPGRQTLTRRIEDKYTVISDKVRKIFAELPAICLTMDAWTESHTTSSYLGMTAHYLQGESMQSVVLGVELLTERHTTQFLTQKSLEFSESWGIDERKVSAIVTDNAPNIVAAAKEAYGSNKHLGCFAHILNLIPSAALGTKKVDNEAIENVPGVPELIAKVKKIVRFSHDSYNFGNAIKRIQMETGKTEGQVLRLLQSVPTRWGSTFKMCDRFLLLQGVIAAAAVEFSEVEMQSGSELKTLGAIRDILQPVHLATTEISEETNPTASKVIPLIASIFRAVEAVELPHNNEMARKFKTFLLQELKRRCGNIEDNMVMAMATLVDPRFAKKRFRSALSASRAITFLETEIIREIKKENAEVLEQEESSGIDSFTGPAAKKAKNVLWEYHDDDVESSRANMLEDLKNAARAEIKAYTDRKLSPRNANPFEEWTKIAHLYPHIYKLARVYLPILATSVPSERLFSLAGLIVDDRGSRLSSEHLQQRIFLASIDDKFWN
ncbi:unnamed protein product [Brassicogethes aeneus]|uniref:HAT C-terminal dimerisation domain-containing protein n=1 Tax=Brassicogethes aeneus TaxID=1431903 RepID=A0A9P0AW96_BRAAE|nr:unnamed protein product [Brassicogethes aeneus]